MRTTWFLAVALTGAVGCGSTIEGGGSGGAGGGGGGGPTTTGSNTTTTTGTNTTTTTGSQTTTGVGGSGGGNTLGVCEAGGGSAVTTSGGGSTTCESEYACDGGAVQVSCTTTGDTEVCDCFLDGSLAGSCGNNAGCSFPQSCCFALLGGTAEPNPGPYGACEESGGTATATTGSGGGTSCLGDYECDGGAMSIECNSTDAGATCTCKDAQSFVLGTCDQPSLSCDYGSSCCYDILN